VTDGTALITAVFSPAGSSVTPEELPAKLEQLLALGRNSWPVNAAREFADAFLASVEGRKKSAAYEVRWLNLGGFCLRPGFGFTGDEYRIEQARRIYAGGLQFGNQAQNEIDWWIFWGRVAGGLNRNQQVDIFQRLSPILLPRGNKKPQRINSSLLREMWRTASSLELLPAGTRSELGDALIRNGKALVFRDNDFWCLARLGARQLFYGPANQVLQPAVVTRWIEALLKVQGAEETLAALARHTGDPVRDVSAATFDAVRSKLKSERHLAILSGEDEQDERAMGRIFGESLPSGLKLASVAKPVTEPRA
jgi:hypothetical protein